MKKLIFASLLLFTSSLYASNVGDEVCRTWTEAHESKWFRDGSPIPFGYERTGSQINNGYTYKRLLKKCIEWRPSTLDKLADKIGNKLEASIAKNNEIMVRHLDQMEDIIGAATELQYQDFIQKLKAEMTKLRTELKK